MRPLADLPDEWRDLAGQQRELGQDAQACTLEWCAEELEQLSGRPMILPSRGGGRVMVDAEGFHEREINN